MKKIVIASIILMVSISAKSQVLSEKDIENKRTDLVNSMKKIKEENLMKGVLGNNNSRISLFSLNSQSYYKNMNNVCKVNFQIDKNGKLETILNNEFTQLDYFKKVLISSNEEVFFSDFYSRYLIAGCQYGEYKNPINLSKNENDNEALNLIFGHIESNFGPSINNVVQENYANALATIQLIVKFGPRDEVLNTLRKTSALNDMQSTLWNLNGYFRIMSGTSIKILLLPENLKKITQISQNDSEKMELLALEIANISSVYDIATLDSNLKEYLFNVDNLNLVVAIKTYNLIKKSMPDIFKQEISQEKNVIAYTELMPKKIIERMKANGELALIQKMFKNLDSIKVDDKKSLDNDREELEKKISTIIYKEIKNNLDFIPWNFNNQFKLTKNFLDELNEYAFIEKRVENKVKISPEDLTKIALPELKIYKGLLENKIPLVFYQNYQQISLKVKVIKEKEKGKILFKYR